MSTVSPLFEVERAYRNVAGDGPLEPLLADDVWEIMVNGPEGVFVEP